ncbi:MAG TPA: prepilin peptidase, partial [Ilumatobacteraceae bacterium]|nr:prepilin peptidase [Ilumatobacteraceae bacterium]
PGLRHRLRSASTAGWELMVIAYTTVLGLLIGSFLTVVVDRVPDGRSIVAPGSACGNCGLQLGPKDLVPVFSWLALRGRCRQCRAWIGVEPLVLEIATAALFCAFAVHFGLSWDLAAFCVWGAALIGLSWIDLRTKRLPRQIIHVAALVGVPLLVIAALVRDEPRRIWMAALGAGCAFVFMALVYVVSRGQMGDGDVRLAPLLGAYLGYLNPGIVAVGLFLAFLAGALVGLVLMAVGRAGRKTAVPFGPFMAAGAVAAVWAGQPLIDLWIHR